MSKIETNTIDTISGSTDLQLGSTNATIIKANDKILFNNSGDGIYLGVTTATASNLLKDYEEGTWTPVYEGATTAGNSPEGDGEYVKIGNLVWVNFAFKNITVSGASGFLRISGLPFQGYNSSGLRVSASGNLRFYNVNLAGNSKYIVTPLVADGNSHIGFIQSGDSTTWQDVTVTNGSNQYLECSIIYRTNT